MISKRLSIVIGLLCFLLVFPQASSALTVTNLNDSGAGSLRDAIANTPPGGTVDFAVTGVITLATELLIDKEITITGPGMNLLTVSGGNTTRVFNILGGQNISISNIRVANGLVTQNFSGGAGIIVSTQNINLELSDCIFENNLVSGDFGIGGAIQLLNSDPTMPFTLMVNRCSFINNRSVNSNSASSGAIGTGSGFVSVEVYDSLFKENVAEGTVNASGGVMAFGATFINFSCTNCTFASNAAISPSSASGGVAVFGSADNRFSCTNCTFYDNEVECSNDGCGIFGGALAAGGLVSSTVSCNFCTFKSNRATCTGNPCFPRGDQLSAAGNTLIEISNTIFDGDNPLNNCFIRNDNVISQITSLGYNIDNGNTCIGSAVGDKVFTDPQLDPFGLRDNGGFTPTIALLLESPAIDMATRNCPPPGTDQRGVDRPQQQVCDIGAYELMRANVPTLSEWGLITLAGTLGMIGFFVIRRRQITINN